MIFETDDYCVDLVKHEDIQYIVDVYNSNVNFLEKHMNTDKISKSWLEKEISEMKEVDFSSCKIVDKRSGGIIGTIDFKIDKESYLSLLMLHKRYSNKGIGKIIYDSFEKYTQIKGSDTIRIDVVTGYDDSVLQFWGQKGFVKYKDIKLNWCNQSLPAVVLKKNI